MTDATTPRLPLSKFAVTLLIGGLIAVGAGSASIYRANALEADSTLVPGVVTKVGDRQGRHMPVTYRYEVPGPDGKPRQHEKTITAHHSLVETWGADRQVQVRVSRTQPETSDLAANNAPFSTGLQWILFGVVATIFGTLRLRKRPEEA
jgi:hypothetical protein